MGLQGGAVLLLLEVCLLGLELYLLERKPAELQGPENLDGRKLLKLPTSALER